MAFVTFCETCFEDVRDVSPILLIVWTSLGIMTSRLRRPVSYKEFCDAIFEGNGIRGVQVNKSLAKLEKMRYIVTLEVENFILIKPTGWEEFESGAFSVCPQKHLQ